MRVRSLATFALACSIAAACSSSSKPAASTTTTSTTASSSAAALTTSSSASAATLSVAMDASLGKQIVVDANGRTVYMFVPDGSSTTSKVPAAIKANWPPVGVTGSPSAGDGIDGSKLTTAAQADGTNQVSYNGHLLYLFAGDSAAGDAKGQALGGNWYVLSPAGDQITS